MTRALFYIGIYVLSLCMAADSFSIVLTFPLLLIVLLGAARQRTRDVTRHDAFWLCIFLFFVVAPCQDIDRGVIGADDPVTTWAYADLEFVEAMAIVVIFCATICAITAFPGKAGRPPARSFGIAPPAALAMNVVAFGLYVVLSGGLSNVAASRLVKDADDVSMASTLALAFQTVTAVILVSAMVGRRWTLPSALAVLAALALLSISQNPFNTPRFFLVAAWLPVVLALLRGRIRATHFYAASLVSLIVIFPVLSITSRYGFGGFAEADEGSSSSPLLSLPFVDVFDTLVHAVRYMEGRDAYLYQKTLAIIAFFIPRFMWPEKPIVGGLDIGNDLYDAGMAGTANLSFFIGGDFYMDLGFAGVAAGGAVVGLLLLKITGASFGVVYRQNLFEYLLIAALPILLRGPVGAVLPLFTCQVFALWSITAVASLVTPRRRLGGTDGGWRRSHVGPLEHGGGAARAAPRLAGQAAAEDATARR